MSVYGESERVWRARVRERDYGDYEVQGNAMLSSKFYYQYLLENVDELVPSLGPHLLDDLLMLSSKILIIIVQRSLKPLKH